MLTSGASVAHASSRCGWGRERGRGRSKGRRLEEVRTREGRAHSALFVIVCSYGVQSVGPQRLYSSARFAIPTVKDFTFSDGTLIPKGTLVSAPIKGVHFDEENYDYADVFGPWRFAKMENASDSESLRNQFVNTRPDFQVSVVWPRKTRLVRRLAS